MQYIIPKEKKIFSYFPPNYLFERLAGRRGRQTVVRPFILRVGATATRATSVQSGLYSAVWLSNDHHSPSSAITRQQHSTTTSTTMSDPREPNSLPPKTVDPSLAAERLATPFTPLKITNFLDGSPQLTDRRRKLEALIIRDPSGVFSNEDNNYMGRTERHTRSIAKFVRLVELCRSAGVGADNGRNCTQKSAVQHIEGEIIHTPEFLTLAATISDDPMPTSLHW
eukprot:scaffold13980_cov200-Alexandrium_tamarense.AAC.2